MRGQHRARVLVTLALAAVFAVSNLGVAAAGDAPRFRPVNGQLDGRTAQQLLTDAFRLDYTLPADEHPLGSGDPCFRLGDHSRVLLLTVPTTCSIERGEAIIGLLGSACSDVEEPPFFAVGAAAQRACAVELRKSGVASATLAVDGGAPVEVARPRFAATTEQQHVTVVADNIIGLEPGPATFVASAYEPGLRHLPVGRHVIKAALVFDDGSTDSARFVIRVVGRNHG